MKSISDSPTPTRVDDFSTADGQWDRLRPIINSLPDGVVIVDANSDIRYANPAASLLFDRAAGELIGTPFGAPLTAGKTTEMEILRRVHGRVVYAELRVVDTSWEGKAAKLVSLRDITDRKDAELKARKAPGDTDAGSQAKSDFLGIMSHELRTPLNAILGYSELMELGISGDLTDVTRKQVGRIRVSAKHLLALVNDILDLAKVEAGRLPVDTLPASVSETLADAIALVEPRAQAKNLELAIMPGSEALPTYVGDAERTGQIIANLLSNAVKCTAPGGRITVDAALAAPAEGAVLLPRNSYVCIRVSDTGTGIPMEKLDTIFEPFVQAETGPTRSHEGSGLGLTIGRGLARAMGGDLTVVSDLGKGSRFTLWLPADVRADHDKPLSVNTPGNESQDMPVPTESIPDAHEGDRQVRGLAEVANKVLSELEPIVARIVACIRSDHVIRPAKDLRTSQLADHLGLSSRTC